MTTNSTNDIVYNLTSINGNQINSINNFNMSHSTHVDINTIVTNAKNDKRFHKLLNLCIKYDIHLFNQFESVYSLIPISNLLIQSNMKQRNLTLEFGTKIREIALNNNSTNTQINWLVEIENINLQYKKKFKEIEIIDYILKNIFTDELLLQMCCIQSNHQISTSQFVINSINKSSDEKLSEKLKKKSNNKSSDEKLSEKKLEKKVESGNLNLCKNKLIKRSLKTESSKYIAVYSN